MNQVLDFDDLYRLVRGKIIWKKCVECDVNGTQYWDGATGLGVNNSPSGIDPEWLDSGCCDSCNGLGFKFYEVSP